MEASSHPDPRPAGELDSLLANAGWLRALAVRLVRNEADADDLVQDTWLAALRARPERPSRSWLGRVLRNAWRDRARGSANRAAREAAVAAGAEGLPPGDVLAERVERQRVLAEAVLALDEPYRGTLILRFYEGLSSAEIARRTGLPADRVRWRLSRAVALLRTELERRHGPGWHGWVAFLVPSAATPAPPLPAPAAAAPTAIGALLVNGKLALSLFLAGAVGLLSWSLVREEAALPAIGSLGAASAPPAVEASAEPEARDAAPGGTLGRRRVAASLAAAFLAPAPEAEAGARLEGRVVSGLTGEGVPGAEVIVYEDGHVVDRTVTLTTGPDGAFAATGLEPDAYDVLCRFPGFAPARLRAVRVGAEAGGAPVELVLEPGSVLAVEVVDAATGRSVGGARVLCVPGDGRGLSPSRLALEADEGATGPGGRVRLEGIGPGLHQVIAQSEEHVVWMHAITVLDAEHELRVELERGGALVGTVRLPDGEPAVDAHVFALPRRPTGAIAFLELPEDAAPVGEDGTYAIERVPDGRYYVCAVRPDGTTAFHTQDSGLRSERVRAGRATEVDLEFPAPAELVGRVVDRAGEPVAGARISVSWGDFKPPHAAFFSIAAIEGLHGAVCASTVTGPDGAFELAPLRISYEPLSIRVRAKGYQALTVEVATEPGRTIARELVLAGLSDRISGSLRTAAGAPVEGIEIGAWSLKADGSLDQLFLDRTDPNGAFSVALPEGLAVTRVEPILRGKDAWVATPESRDVPPGTAGVEFELRSKRSFRGVAVDDAGSSIRGFHVSLLDSGGRWRDFEQVDLGQGRFELPYDPEDHRAAIVTAPGFVPARFDPIVDDPVRAVLVRVPPLSGRVVDAGGAPVGGARVALATLEGLRFPVRSEHAPAARTGADGTFVLRGVPEDGGQTLLVAPGIDGAPSVVPVPLGPGPRGELEIRLPGAHRIEVVATDEAGAALDGARVVPLDSVGWPLHPGVERGLHADGEGGSDGLESFGQVVAGRTTLWLADGDYHLLLLRSEDDFSAFPLRVSGPPAEPVRLDLGQ